MQHKRSPQQRNAHEEGKRCNRLKERNEEKIGKI